ncbi:MAG TPA: Nif3-like dinuclear metal center hexameric protein [Jatrophihabitans sp.]|nr:Nif3-like dinuclear metal center hexameric protein [Jatrophihabitans sp.]
MPDVGELITALEGWFDPRWAEPWDAVGLVCGDRDDPVERVLLAVDPVPATVAEAIEVGAQLLVTHHPLLLTGVHGVPVDDPKGALVHRMIRAGVAHFVAHTNADVARPGVSDALAQCLGLADTEPLEARSSQAHDKLVVFVPCGDAETLVDALAAAGAGRLGDYDRCAWSTNGTGTFRPLQGANPTIGSVGAIEQVPETRVEMIVPRAAQASVLAALRSAHPYEEPAFDLLPTLPLPSSRGTGRVGRLPDAMPLRRFVAHAAASLPATAWGVRAAGDPERAVRTVAVCGGSGADYIEAARAAGADAFLTADLKHHRAVEAVTERGADAMALIDAAHWATEAPWLDAVAAALVDRFGTSVDIRVSRRVTDPWTLHVPSPEASQVST